MRVGYISGCICLRLVDSSERLLLRAQAQQVLCTSTFFTLKCFFLVNIFVDPNDHHFDITTHWRRKQIRGSHLQGLVKPMPLRSPEPVGILPLLLPQGFSFPESSGRVWLGRKWRKSKVRKLISYFWCLFGTGKGKWKNSFSFSFFFFYTSFLHYHFLICRVLQLILWSYKSQL